MRDARYSRPLAVSIALFAAHLSALFIAGSVVAEARTAAPPKAKALPISVEADSFVVIMAEEKAIWRGDVRATQGNYTFRTSQFTIYLEQIRSQSESDATDSNTGTARLHHGYELSANNLTYDISNDEIIASGKSELRRAEELIRADRITYAVTDGIARAVPRKNGRVFVQFFSEPGKLPFPTASLGPALGQ